MHDWLTLTVTQLRPQLRMHLATLFLSVEGCCLHLFPEKSHSPY